MALSLFDNDLGFVTTGSPTQIGKQLVGFLALTLWASLISFFFFYSLKQNERLRVNYVYELIGLDFIESQLEGKIKESLLATEL